MRTKYKAKATEHLPKHRPEIKAKASRGGPVDQNQITYQKYHVDELDKI
jgi:hypothetical protein